MELSINIIDENAASNQGKMFPVFSPETTKCILLHDNARPQMQRQLKPTWKHSTTVFTRNSQIMTFQSMTYGMSEQHFTIDFVNSWIVQKMKRPSDLVSICNQKDEKKYWLTMDNIR